MMQPMKCRWPMVVLALGALCCAGGASAAERLSDKALAAAVGQATDQWCMVLPLQDCPGAGAHPCQMEDGICMQIVAYTHAYCHSQGSGRNCDDHGGAGPRPKNAAWSGSPAMGGCWGSQQCPNFVDDGEVNCWDCAMQD